MKLKDKSLEEEFQRGIDKDVQKYFPPLIKKSKTVEEAMEKALGLRDEKEDETTESIPTWI